MIMHWHQIKGKLGENVQLTLLRMLFPFPEFCEDILLHHPLTNFINASLIPEGQNNQAINKEKLIVLELKTNTSY